MPRWLHFNIPWMMFNNNYTIATTNDLPWSPSKGVESRRPSSSSETRLFNVRKTERCEENVLNFFFKGSWSLRSPALGRSGLAPPTSPQGPSAAAPRSTSRFLAFIALLRLTWELTLNGIDSHIGWQQNLHSLFCPPCYCSLELVHLLQDALVTVWWKTFCNFTQELRSSLTLWCQSKKYIWSEILSLKLFQCVATHIISKFDWGILSL